MSSFYVTGAGSLPKLWTANTDRPSIFIGGVNRGQVKTIKRSKASWWFL